MSSEQQWQYQLRIDLSDELAEVARRDPDDPAIRPLTTVLAEHGTVMKSQYEAFAGYCEEAEREGVENYPLYQWTKDTIENPAKKAKYQKSFTLYVKGYEVYDKEEADSLEADLRPLVDNGLIARMAKHDTNPANNPQMPDRYRK